jgi:hypothetical protein
VEVSKVEETKIVKPSKVVTDESHDLVPAGLSKVVVCRPGQSEITMMTRSYYPYSQIISVLYSYLGQRCLLGDVEAVKFLYINAWEERSALIRTIIELQLHLTAVEIGNDTRGIYSDEFLYYWGMICLGKVSPFIPEKFATAAFCFKRIKTDFPKAKARLAFIGLLKSKEPFKSLKNLRRIDTLRNWVKKGDSFSRIALSVIMFSRFLMEKQKDYLEPVSIALSQLIPICQKGHPVALRLYIAMLDCLSSTGDSDAGDMRIGSGFRVNPDPKDKRIAGFPVNPDTLLDF